MLLLALWQHQRKAPAEIAGESTDHLPTILPTVNSAIPKADSEFETGKITSDDPVVSSQLKTLSEILSSRNDNDPRLDTELKTLSELAKEKIREMYKALPSEKRNERGTLVFLLGRNLSSPADFEFMRNVLLETPCRSLADCTKNPAVSFSPNQDEHPAAQGALLAYPQLVALQSLEKYLATDDGYKELALDLVKSAESSQVLEVRKMATSILNKSR